MNLAQVLGTVLLTLVSLICLADTCLWLVCRDRRL